MIPNSKDIEIEVLKGITPDETEKRQMRNVIEALKEKVNQEIKKTNLPIGLELVGSTAKDTFIRNSVDIDLFLVFPSTVSRDTLQTTGLAIGRAVLEDKEECFAEHPYVRGFFQGFKTELVPCFEIESATQKISAVDRTPLHTKYVKQHLKESQKNEVRLIKQFLKGIGCYGAEAEIEGFSGYLCELLILKYGTFQQMIESAQHWRHGESLALNGHLSSFDTPLTVIDPVDAQRNVASALSKEKFDRLVTACKQYVKNPTITFFFPNTPEPWSLEDIKKEIGKRKFIGVKLPQPDIIAENLYPQIRKATRSIKDLCKQHGFTIVDSTFFIKNSYVYIVLQPKSLILSKTVIHQGPPLNLKKNADEFLRKWLNNSRATKKPFEKNNRLYVEIERQYTDMRDLLHDQVSRLSLGKHIGGLLKQRVEILNQDGLLLDDLRLFWTMFLDKKMPWER